MAIVSFLLNLDPLKIFVISSTFAFRNILRIDELKFFLFTSLILFKLDNINENLTDIEDSNIYLNDNINDNNNNKENYIEIKDYKLSNIEKQILSYSFK